MRSRLHRFLHVQARVAALLAIVLGPATASADDFEVWLVDQSNSNGQMFGGTIYIYDGARLNGAAAAATAPTDVIDLGGATAAFCLAGTGANPVRPHMVLFNASHSHAVLSFVASGHVVIFDAATRAPVACLRMSAGAGGARQAHAAFPSADGSYILVANQNGKLLERIDSNYATNTFTLNAGATINLATCTTPNGAACQSAADRPDNAPICPILDSTSTLGFVTLRGGGLFVVNPKATPMQIVAEYDKTTIHGNGCGGLQAAGTMFMNSGGGTATNQEEFDVYGFPLTGYSAANLPNTPAPAVLLSNDTGEHDSHGMTVSKHDRYLWVLDRAINVAEIFHAASRTWVGRVDLNTLPIGGLAPDLADISPSGNRIFVSLRGPNPLSGDPHVSTGSLPGLGVIVVTGSGRTGILKGVVPISNKDVGGIERADPHGIRVRRK